jgi:hypothetical protein
LVGDFSGLELDLLEVETSLCETVAVVGCKGRRGPGELGSFVTNAAIILATIEPATPRSLSMASERFPAHGHRH